MLDLEHVLEKDLDDQARFEENQRLFASQEPQRCFDLRPVGVGQQTGHECDNLEVCVHQIVDELGVIPPGQHNQKNGDDGFQQSGKKVHEAPLGWKRTGFSCLYNSILFALCQFIPRHTQLANRTLIKLSVYNETAKSIRSNE